MTAPKRCPDGERLNAAMHLVGEAARVNLVAALDALDALDAHQIACPRCRAVVP